MKVEERTPNFRIRLHVGIATIFVVIVTILTAVVVWNNHQEASAAALRTADQLFREIAAGADERMNGILGAVKTTVDVASALPSLAERPRYDGLASPPLEAMIRLLGARPYIFSVFVGYASGEWIQVSAPRGDPDVSATFQVPEGADLIIRTISLDRDGKRRQYLRYLDDDRHVVGARSEPDPTYDPRPRGWYVNAIAAKEALFSEPFIFFRLQKPGITASRRLIGGSGVVAVAITLSNFSDFLSDLKASPNADVFLFDSKAQILARQDEPAPTVPLRASQAGPSEPAGLPKADEVGDPILEAVVRDALAAPGGRPATKRLELDGQTYLARVEPVGLRLGLDQYVAVVAPLSDFTGHIERMQRRSIVAALVALAVALPLIFLIARRVAAKLAALAAEADKVREFDLENPVDVESFFLEVHNLSRAFGAMKQAVSVFGRYVPKALVREIVQSGTAPELGGHRQEITVLFTDIADFTRIAEETAPEDLMLRTSEYFEALGSALSRHHGVVDKYIGDAIMALWNAPSRDDDHVAHACAAVLACREVSRDLADNWSQRAILPFRTRFGLHCGEAVVGNVGGADRIDFTAVGGTINLASRLEALNKRYGTEILVSGDVAGRVGDKFLMRRIDRVQPVGVASPTDIYELIAVRPGDTNLPKGMAAGQADQELCALWDQAYAIYLDRDWQGAVASFEALLERFPQDSPCQALVVRCRALVDKPPGPDWDGVTRLSRK